MRANPPQRDQQSVQVGTASTPLLGPNSARIGVIFGTPRVNRVSISFVGDAVLDRGLPLQPGQAWQVLIDDKLAGLLQGPISAIAAVGAEWITVVEIFR